MAVNRVRGEHAGLARELHQKTHGGVLQRPQMSVGRAAMLGAARAVYLLEPDDQTDRNVRVAQLATNEVRDAHNYIKAVAPGLTSTQPARLLNSYLAAVKIEAETILAQAHRPTNSCKDETSLLREVSPILADGHPDPESALLSVWTKGSAVAHGRSWVWGVLDDGEHPALHFVGIWSLTLGLLGHAWSLWNQRRGIDSPSAYPPDGWMPDPALSYVPPELPGD